MVLWVDFGRQDRNTPYKWFACRPPGKCEWGLIKLGFNRRFHPYLSPLPCREWAMSSRRTDYAAGEGGISGFCLAKGQNPVYPTDVLLVGLTLARCLSLAAKGKELPSQ